MLRRIESYRTDPAVNPRTIRALQIYLAHPSIAGSQKIDPSYYAYYILLGEDDIQREPESHMSSLRF